MKKIAKIPIFIQNQSFQLVICKPYLIFHANIQILDQFLLENSNVLDLLPLKNPIFATKIQIDTFSGIFFLTLVFGHFSPLTHCAKLYFYA